MLLKHECQSIQSNVINNGKRHIKWHETCKCVCNNKQRWNNDRCRCECKKLIDKGIKCDRSCDTGQYLDYKNCKCRKKLVDKLVEECGKNITENEMVYNGTLNDYKKVCNSCTIYIGLFALAFLIIFSISSAFIYFHWYLI